MADRDNVLENAPTPGLGEPEPEEEFVARSMLSAIDWPFSFRAAQGEDGVESAASGGQAESPISESAAEPHGDRNEREKSAVLDSPVAIDSAVDELKTADALETVGVESGLISMLMLDSPNKGQDRGINIKGNAALTGANGAGKTTMIKALLLFSGNPPSRIPTGEGKAKFLDYYFQRETSLIAFCYANHLGQERSLVYFKTADGLRARFFRCGALEDLFIEDPQGARKRLGHGGLRARADQLGVRCSNSITQADAQRVLLGHCSNSGTDRKTLGAEIAASDFSLAPPGARLGDMSEICKAVAERRSTLQQLAESAARSAMEAAKLGPLDQADLALEMTISGSLAALLPSLRGVSTANAAKADFESASEAHQRAQEGLAWQAAARSALKSQAEYLERERIEREERSKKELAEFEEKSDLLEKEIQARGSKARADELSAQALRKQAAQKRSAGEAMRREKAQHWLDRQAETPALESDIRRIRAELTQLEGVSAEAAEKMRRAFLNDQEEQANRQKDAIREDERDAEAKARREVGEIAQDRAAQIQRLDTESSAGLAKANEAMVSAQVALAAERAIADRMAPPAEAVAALMQAQEKVLEEAEKEAKSARDKSAADLAHASAASAASQAKEERHRAQRSVEEKKARLEEARVWANPHPTSVLAVARKQSPAVARELLAGLSDRALLEGRSLNEEEEELAGLRSGWLGLELDLSALMEKPSSALLKEEGSEQLEGRARAAYDDAVAKEAELARQADAKEMVAKGALESRLAAEKSARASKESLEIARSIKNQREAELSKATRVARESAAALIKKASDSFTEAQRAVAAEKAKVELLRKAIHANFDLKKARADAELARALADFKTRREGVERSLASTKESMEAAIQRGLAQHGADPAEILAKRRKAEAIEREVDEIKKRFSLAQKWRLWVESDEPTIANDEENAADLEQCARDHKLEEQALTQKNKELRVSFQAREKALRAEADELSNTRRLCLDRLAELGPPSSLAPSEERARELYELGAQALMDRHLVKAAELSKARAQRSEALSRCHQAFRAHPGSPAEEFWGNRKHEEPAALDADERDSYWQEAYRAWHEDGNGESHAAALTAQAKIVGAETVEFQRQLERFKLECSRVSQAIKKGLEAAERNAKSGGGRFKAISDLSIGVECDLSSAPFYKALALAAKEHEAWMESREPLPPEELLRSLASLLEHARAGDGRLRAELTDLVGISGSVVEVGKLKRFSTKQSISNLSSNGLSYLIVLMVQIAFLNQARRDCPTARVAWAIDELRDLDNANARGVLGLLAENRVDLLSAFPDGDTDLINEMEHVYLAESDGSLGVILPKESQLKEERARRRAMLARAKEGVEPQPARSALAEPEFRQAPGDQHALEGQP